MISVDHHLQRNHLTKTLTELLSEKIKQYKEIILFWSLGLAKIFIYRKIGLTFEVYGRYKNNDVSKMNKNFPFLLCNCYAV